MTAMSEEPNAESGGGERRFIGGPLDGEVERLAHAHPSDYPLIWQYPRHPGGHYERDLDGGLIAVYRWVMQIDGSGEP